MKFLTLIALLSIFSVQSMAGYMSKSDLESCAFDRTDYSKKYVCEKLEASKCYLVPSGYNCQYNRKRDSKSEAEECFNDSDCQSKLSAKVCSDSREKAVQVLDTDPKEVYCTKEYIGEDSALKTSYMEDQATQKATRDAKIAEVKNTIITKLKAGENLTQAQLRRVLLYLLRE